MEEERYPICRSDRGALSGVPRESVPTSVDGENPQPRARVFVEALNLKNNALYISDPEFFRRRRPRGPNRMRPRGPIRLRPTGPLRKYSLNWCVSRLKCRLS